MMVALTSNAISDIQRDQNPVNPIVQVLSIKKIANQNPADTTKPDRYRLQLSDGTFKQPSAMLATQLNHLVLDGHLEKNCVICIPKYICNTVGGRRIIIVLEVAIVAGDVGDVIGNPETIREGDEPSAAAVPAAVPAAPAAAPITPVSYVTPAPHATPVANPAGMARTPAAVAPSPRGFPATSPANPYARSATSANNMAPMGGDPNRPVVTPIDSLNPYKSRWCIRARVTKRGPKKEWTNEKGSGCLFSVDLLDDSGEVRATGFNEVFTKFYDTLVEGKVFYFRGGKLKPANRKYSTINHEYEISFDNSTEIWEAEDDGAKIPQLKYNFVPIANLEQVAVDSTTVVNVDILAVVVDVGPVGSIKVKSTGKDLAKRELQVQDAGCAVVGCTLWGADAIKFEEVGGAVGVVLALKGARLSDFSGRSLSVSNSTNMSINPDMPEVHQLLGWWQGEGKSAATTKLTSRGGGGGAGGDRRILLHQIKDEGLGARPDGKADYFLAKGTIVFTRKTDGSVYKACRQLACNKKVVESHDNTYTCEKCNETSGEFKYRIMLTFNIADATSEFWVTCFQEAAELVLGRSAQELGEMKASNPEAFEACVGLATFQTFSWKCRAKNERYNEEDRVKVTVMDITRLNPITEAKYLISKIHEFGV